MQLRGSGFFLPNDYLSFAHSSAMPYARGGDSTSARLQLALTFQFEVYAELFASHVGLLHEEGNDSV